MKASLLFLVMVVGCSSKADPIVTPAPTTEILPEGQRSPAEQCFAACDRDHAASAATFDAMDDCSEEHCKLGVDDAPISPKACAPIDQKKITYNFDEVDNCIAALCCPQATACANDPDCVAASSCYDRCIALH